MAAYVPQRGDFVSLAFHTRSGHEQAGHRSALVVSKDLFNRATGMCTVCPVTNTRRDYPFHVPVPDGECVTGVVMVEQVTSIDFASRRAKRIGAASQAVLEETLAVLDACIY